MDVFFESQGGSAFSIEVGYFDRVSEIKEKIEKYQHIPVSKQTLVFNGRVLHDDLDVEQCQILHNSRIQLFISDHHNRCRNRHNHHQHNNNNNNTHQVFNMEKPPPSDSIKGQDSNQKKLRLTVMPKCGTRKIPVEVKAADNVGELRKELTRIHQKLHFTLPQEGYFFIYKRNVMDDDRSFRWHNVENGDTIEIFNGSVSGGS